MNILDWMNAPEGYVSRHTDMPAQRQTQAKTLCWEYNRTAPFEGESVPKSLGSCWAPAIRSPSLSRISTVTMASISIPTA